MLARKENGVVVRGAWIDLVTRFMRCTEVGHAFCRSTEHPYEPLRFRWHTPAVWTLGTCSGGSQLGLGVYVSACRPAGPAAKAGLLTGDQVFEINGESLLPSCSLRTAVAMLEGAAIALITVKTGSGLPRHLLDLDEFELNLGREVLLDADPVDGGPVRATPITADTSGGGQGRGRGSGRATAGAQARNRLPRPPSGLNRTSVIMEDVIIVEQPIGGTHGVDISTTQ